MHIEYDYAEYYMNDIGFRHTLSNPTHLNEGDQGYMPINDDGAFIIEMRYNARGVGLKSKGGSFASDTALFALGFVPYVGPVTSAYSYIKDVYKV